MRRCKNWLTTYMQYSQFSEAPDYFHFWSGVSTIAGALRRKVWIDMGYFEWTPNFYIVFVAPPGVVQKSTTADIGMNLLKQVPGIHFGPDSVTWQALAMALAESTEGVEMNDGTYFPMSALTIVASEFGTFLDPTDRVMVDVLVSLWDSKRDVWKKLTKSSGADNIENPWVNIVACTTPAWIEGYFPEYLIGGGFTSRTIFVYADRKRRLVAYPSKMIADNHLKIREDLIHDLEQISFMKGAFTLTPEAFAYGEQWYTDHYSSAHTHLDSNRFGGYLARKQTHIHKLAMVLSASQRQDMTITKDDLQMSHEIITGLEQDMPKVFGHIGMADSGRLLSELVRVVVARKRIHRVDLYRAVSSKMSLKEYQDVEKSAIYSRQILVQQEGNEVYYVAPTEAKAAAKKIDV